VKSLDDYSRAVVVLETRAAASEVVFRCQSP